MRNENPFAAGFSQTCKAWSALAAFLSSGKDSHGKLVYGVQGIGEKTTKVIWRADGVCKGLQ